MHTKVCSKPNSKQRKAAQMTFVQKWVHKMLTKLTPAGFDFTNMFTHSFSTCRSQKCKKDIKVISFLLHFWDLLIQKLHKKWWWNRPHYSIILRFINIYYFIYVIIFYIIILYMLFSLSFHVLFQSNVGEGLSLFKCSVTFKFRQKVGKIKHVEIEFL